MTSNKANIDNIQPAEKLSIRMTQYIPAWVTHTHTYIKTR